MWLSVFAYPICLLSMALSYIHRSESRIAEIVQKSYCESFHHTLATMHKVHEMTPLTMIKRTAITFPLTKRNDSKTETNVKKEEIKGEVNEAAKDEAKEEIKEESPQEDKAQDETHCKAPIPPPSPTNVVVQ